MDSKNFLYVGHIHREKDDLPPLELLQQLWNHERIGRLNSASTTCKVKVSLQKAIFCLIRNWKVFAPSLQTHDISIEISPPREEDGSHRIIFRGEAAAKLDAKFKDFYSEVEQFYQVHCEPLTEDIRELLESYPLTEDTVKSGLECVYSFQDLVYLVFNKGLVEEFSKKSLTSVLHPGIVPERDGRLKDAGGDVIMKSEEMSEAGFSIPQPNSFELTSYEKEPVAYITKSNSIGIREDSSIHDRFEEETRVIPIKGKYMNDFLRYIILPKVALVGSKLRCRVDLQEEDGRQEFVLHVDSKTTRKVETVHKYLTELVYNGMKEYNEKSFTTGPKVKEETVVQATLYAFEHGLVVEFDRDRYQCKVGGCWSDEKVHGFMKMIQAILMPEMSERVAQIDPQVSEK